MDKTLEFFSKEKESSIIWIVAFSICELLLLTFQVNIILNPEITSLFFKLFNLFIIVTNTYSLTTYIDKYRSIVKLIEVYLMDKELE